MRSDAKGNLYIARYDSEIELNGMKPTNIAFGGENGTQVYVTVADKGNIETFLVDEPGRSWVMRKKVRLNL